MRWHWFKELITQGKFKAVRWIWPNYLCLSLFNICGCIEVAEVNVCLINSFPCKIFSRFLRQCAPWNLIWMQYLHCLTVQTSQMYRLHLQVNNSALQPLLGRCYCDVMLCLASRYFWIRSTRRIHISLWGWTCTEGQAADWWNWVFTMGILSNIQKNLLW